MINRTGTNPERTVRVFLRELKVLDVSDRYAAWMNDPEVVLFTEARHASHTIESLRAFVAACEANPANHLLGIFESDSALHIGNVKIGPVHPNYRTAGFGLIVGDKGSWGKGIASEAIRLAAEYAFADLGLHKLTAGVVEGNVASMRAFLKNGFVVEGTKRRQNFVLGEWRDETLLGLLEDEWRRA